MKIGDLVRYKQVINHRTMEKTEWSLGVLVNKRHNICDVLTRDGEKITLWARYNQKAGKKDAKR